MKMTYIIGYKHREDRFSNLEKTLEWLESMPEIEVHIVEQDTESKFPNRWNVRHTFVRNPYPYNRSWAFNIGSMDSDSDIYAFGDSDLVMKKEEFLESVSKMTEYDVVSPYRSVLDLTKEESKGTIEDWVGIKRPGRGETDNQKINLCGGLVLFTKDAFNKVGGWNEDFIGWGGEDDFMTLKVEVLGLRSLEMPYRIFHIYHDRETPDLNFYQRNLMILNSARGATKQAVDDYVEKILPTIGDKNKYIQK
jgi:GT2 family glycosyltransferase